MKSLLREQIFILLLNAVSETSQAIEGKSLQDLYLLLKRINQYFETNKNIVSDTQEAKQILTSLEKLIIVFKKLFELLFELLSKKISKELKAEVDKFLDNLENFKEDIAVLTDEDLWQEVKDIYENNFNENDFINV